MDNVTHIPIRLPRTGSADVTFTGRLLAESGPDNARDQTRSHTLRLYAMEPRGYAVAIAYETRWEGEQGHDDVYVIGDDPQKVVEALERHDPVACVAGYPPGEQFQAKQTRLLTGLKRRYDTQVSDLLRQAEITVDASALEPSWADQLAMRRYRDLLRRGLADLALTRGEACLICDALNGTMLFAALDEHDGTYMFIPAEIADSIHLDGTDEKWGVDGEALGAKLAAASPAALCAIADACERFWERPERDTDELLREVGLLQEKPEAKRGD